MKLNQQNCPITCLYFCEGHEILLVASGGLLEAFSSSSECLDSLPIFKNTTHQIHRIVELENSSFAILGGKSLRVISYCPKLRILQEIASESLEFEDWTLDVRWIKNKLYSISAHNVVLRREKEATETIQCSDEKCILYSASLLEDEKAVVVLGGTVFRQVIIWICEGHGKGQVVHRLEGHEGVIFSVEFSAQTSLICSTSDDRTARLWKVNKSSTWNDAELTPLFVLKEVHSSRIFKSHFVSDGSKIVTGGEDSVLAIWDTSSGKCVGKLKAGDGSSIRSIASRQEHIFGGSGNGSVKRFLINQDSDKATKQVDIELKDGDVPKLLCFFSNSQLAILTQMGSLILRDDQGKSCVVFSDKDMENYALMKSNGENLYFATINGFLKWTNLPQTDLKSIKVFEGKIFALQLLRPSSRILICGPGGAMKLFQHDKEMKHVSDLILPPCKDQRWFSTAIEFHSKLLVGDRNGNLHIFDAFNGCLLQTLTKVHGRHGVGFVKQIDNSTFLTGGRDNMLKTFQFKSEKAELTISQHLKVSWLEDLFQDYVVGFHSSNFIIQSVSDGSNLVEVSCGGGHRSWDFDGSNLAFVKDKRVFLCQNLVNTDDPKTFKNGLHTLCINCLTHFQMGSKNYLITGGEDTMIKILKVDQSLKVEHTLRSHLSSIKCMDLIDLDTHEKLMVSAGGRAQFKVWLIKFNSDRLTVTETASHMLKGNDKQRQRSWRDHDWIDDTETRYLSVLAKKIEKDQFQFVTACSDGVIRIFELVSRKIALICETRVMQHPSLSLAWFKENIVAADTIGQLTLYSSSLEEIGKVEQVHENGINSIVVLKDLIYTGGDDGGVSVSSSTKTLQNVPQSHAAHVTGLKKIDPKHLASCSVDQRVTLWSVSEHDGMISQRCQFFSHVPDVHSASSWTDQEGNRIVAVAGIGIELLYF